MQIKSAFMTNPIKKKNYIYKTISIQTHDGQGWELVQSRKGKALEIDAHGNIHMVLRKKVEEV